MFDLVDIPPRVLRRSDKWKDLKEALLSAPPGKAVRADLSVFPNNQPANYLRIGRYGMQLRTRKLPDGWYLWLEPMSLGKQNGNP